ncbi:hypothetical protein [Corynebacterium sp. H130]
MTTPSVVVVDNDVHILAKNLPFQCNYAEMGVVAPLFAELAVMPTEG